VERKSELTVNRGQRAISPNIRINCSLTLFINLLSDPVYFCLLTLVYFQYQPSQHPHIHLDLIAHRNRRGFGRRAGDNPVAFL